MKKIKPAISRDDLLNRANKYVIHQFSDGTFDNIEAYESGTLINSTKVLYESDAGGDQQTRLKQVSGFLFPELVSIILGQSSHWHDRNPLVIFLYYNSIDAPAVNSTKWTYTVPKGRKCYIEYAACEMMRISVANPGGYAECNITFTPNKQIKNNILDAVLVTNNAGDSTNKDIGQTIILLAGDILTCETEDLSTGGQIFFFGCIKGTEFDS